MPFPVAKLISLGLKQASKYVASFVKQKAREHERMRKIIVKTAEWHHKLSVMSQLNILGMGKPKTVQPLTPEAALELGTEIVGDLVIVLCGLAIYILVESRGAFKSKDTTADKALEEVSALKQTVTDLSLRLEEQTEKIQSMESLLKHNMYSETSNRVLKELDEEAKKKISHIVVKR